MGIGSRRRRSSAMAGHYSFDFFFYFTICIVMANEIEMDKLSTKQPTKQTILKKIY
jgi:hypothetical protein